MAATRNLQAIDAPELRTTGFHVLDQPRSVQQPRRLVRQVARRRFARLEQQRSAVDALRPLPGPGESLHGASAGAFSGWMLAQAIVALLAVPVDSLTIATLGFNRANADDLCRLLDAGDVRSVLLLVSDYFRSSDRTIFADIRRELEGRGQRVAIARSHAKLLLFVAGGRHGRHIVVETSANLRSSMNWEQFVISDDAALLAFHRDWIHDVLQEATP
jgi:hypothetical protein